MFEIRFYKKYKCQKYIYSMRDRERVRERLFQEQTSQDIQDVSPWCPLLITDHIFEKMVSLIVFRHKFYQNLACGPHFQFNNHELFEKVDCN